MKIDALFVRRACTPLVGAALLLVGCAAPQADRFAVIDGERAPAPEIEMGSEATIRRVLTLAETDSRVMDHLTHLCETYGTRLTGSTACEEAGIWARDRFEAWGLSNARLARWGEVHARFDRLESTGEIVTKPRRRGGDGEEPAWETERTLEFTTLSWTRGTDGPVVAPVVRMPGSLETLEENAEAYEGAWVLLPAMYPDRRGVRRVGYSMRERHELRHEIRTGEYDPFSEPEPELWTGTVDHGGTEYALRFLPERAADGSIVGGQIVIPDFFEGPITETIHNRDSLRFVWPNPMGPASIDLAIDDDTMIGIADEEHEIELAVETRLDDHALTREADRVLARVLERDPAGFISSSLDERVWTTRPNGWQELELDDLPVDVEVSVRRSDYDHINSRLADGQSVHARFDLPHEIEAGPFPVYNTIAEIRGTTKPEEVVIVSAHLDSWDGPGSQGTVDNGTGSSVVLEAARLLALAGAEPDRTIRFILWTGEEQGLWGSRKYVESLSEEQLGRISAVFVDDGGTNYEGGLPAADHMVEYLAAATAPVNGRFFSETDGEHMNVNIRPTGEELRTHSGSDHAPFNKVGVPGFFWDEVGRADYRAAWHTQNDRLDQAIPEYLVQSSACMAITAYNLACAPELLPREAEEPAEETIAGAVSEAAPAGR